MVLSLWPETDHSEECGNWLMHRDEYPTAERSIDIIYSRLSNVRGNALLADYGQIKAGLERTGGGVWGE